jgi:hypothetical protein
LIDVLHCDKSSMFCHIAASTLQFAIWDLLVSGDNGAGPQRGFWTRVMLVDRQRRMSCLGALFACALLLGGCSSQIADLPGVGVPSDAPARPKEPGAYLPVNDLPPNRDEEVLDPKERAKIQAELTAARDRQAAAAAAKTAAATNSK